MEKDLTRGKPARVLLRFALPVIGGNLFQLFYTLADSVIVGRTLGADAGLYRRIWNLSGPTLRGKRSVRNGTKRANFVAAVPVFYGGVDSRMLPAGASDSAVDADA